MSTTQSINTGTVTTLSDTDLVLAYDSGGTLKPISKANLASLIRDSIKVGGRNLLKNSGTPKTTSEYTFGHYLLSEAPSTGEECVLTIWGTLGEDRTEFTAFNSSGTAYLKNLTKVEEGVYQAKFKWANGKNSSIWLYQMPSTASSASTVSHIKLERGNVATDWTPAPEDYLTQSGGVISCTSSRYAGKGGQHERVYGSDRGFSDFSNAEWNIPSTAEWNNRLQSRQETRSLSLEQLLDGERPLCNGNECVLCDSSRDGLLGEVSDSRAYPQGQILLESVLVGRLGELESADLHSHILIVTKRRKEVAA